MIYTVTFNPSLDYIVGLESFKEGEVNRSKGDEIFAGGKGINVSMVLNNLGISNVALGFIGGFTGDEIEKRLQNLGCKTDFVKITGGISRINVKIKAEQESEINGQGPEISAAEQKQLFSKLSTLSEGDTLVLAGSIPSSLPADTYEQMMRMLKDKSIRIIVDATGDLLKNVLKFQPFLIKPNKHELEEMFAVTIASKEEIITYAKKLQAMGAQNVLISLAAKGALLLDEKGTIIEKPAPQGRLINSVGAGDSMVAGFIAGYEKNNDYQEALEMGIATGSASAFSKRLATQKEVKNLLKSMK
ncbi:1-phosphofructokinase [Eubacteriaceae bacterium ES2]|nr:1-phosphofructokinase [Eubacteriaceae bacterium ES2]